MDPLPSWNDGFGGPPFSIRGAFDAEEADFISARTHRGFDNDGTLWVEQPLQAQFYFALDRSTTFARRDPSSGNASPQGLPGARFKTIAGLSRREPSSSS
jgi:hypothetical protein